MNKKIEKYVDLDALEEAILTKYENGSEVQVVCDRDTTVKLLIFFAAYSDIELLGTIEMLSEMDNYTREYIFEAEHEDGIWIQPAYNEKLERYVISYTDGPCYIQATGNVEDIMNYMEAEEYIVYTISEEDSKQELQEDIPKPDEWKKALDDVLKDLSDMYDSKKDEPVINNVTDVFGKDVYSMTISKDDIPNGWHTISISTNNKNDLMELYKAISK